MREKMLRFGSIVLVSCLFQLSVSAQEIKVSSGFVKDSVSIGEPITYYLTARYPESVMALFPDSTFTFSPFEFNDKTFFPTKTTNGISFDSAVYELSTFEIEKTQYLSLPVYVTTARDCTAFESARDSVFLIEQIKIPATDTVTLKSLTLKSNTLYERVLTQFNTFILLIVLSIIVVAAIIAWVFFGKRIIRYFRIKKLEKKHKKFIADYSLKLAQLNENFLPESAEKTLLTWKVYMEGLSKIPYTKYTTREIKEAFAGTTVGVPLSSIDRMIYGGIKPESLNDFQELKSEAEDSYQKKIQQADDREINAPLPETSSNSKTATVVSKSEGKPPVEYKLDDLYAYAELLRPLPCPFCHRTTQKLNGTVLYTVRSIIVLTRSLKKPIIACPECLNKKNNRAILTTALLGWWGVPWGLINTPQYIYLNIKAKKQNNKNQPNDVLLSLTLKHAAEIEENKDNVEKLKQIIKPKKSWWQF